MEVPNLSIPEGATILPIKIKIDLSQGVFVDTPMQLDGGPSNGSDQNSCSDGA